MQKAYTEAKNKYPIYLFFSVNGSGRFVGMAQMISDIQLNTNFNLWKKNEKWKGFFFVMWIYIKDIPNKVFAHIENKLNNNNIIIDSRNAQEVNYEAGINMLQIFKDYQNKTSIIDDFSYYEYQQNQEFKENNKSNL